MTAKHSPSWLALLPFFALVGCQTTTSSIPDRAVFADEPAPVAATPAQVARVVRPVPEAAPADYVVTSQTVRVMAIEPGDGPDGTFAVVSDTTTWATKNLRVGDSLGRGFSVRTLDERGVVFADAKGDETRALVERDTTLTRIEHRFDRAVRYEGRGHFSLAPSVARDALATRGSGATFEHVDGLAEPGVRVAVRDATLASSLGLRNDDILLTVDGERVTPERGDALLARTTDASGPVVIRAYRQGTLHTWTFDPVATK